MTVTLSLPSSPELKRQQEVCGPEFGDGLGANASTGKSKAFRRCQQIIDYYRAESQKPQHEQARWLVQQLTDEEQEIAAQCSYAYWFLSRYGSQPEDQQDESTRFATAMREANRHNNTAETPREILKILKATLEFHKSHKTRLFRTCMAEDDETTEETIDDMLLSRQRRDRIHDEMFNYQTNVIRGYDRDERAIFFAFPRKKAGTPQMEEAFVDSMLYTMERAVACSEYLSVGRQDQIFCIIDIKGGSCPPFKNLQAAVGVMQKYYPGRLRRSIVLNAPYIATAMWKMLKPFLDPVTASKFVFPRGGGASKDSSLISEMIDESQAMPVLLPGRGKLSPNVDVNRSLYEVPFHELYDYNNHDSSPTKQTMEKEIQHPNSTKSTSTASLSITESFSSDSDNDSSRCVTIPSRNGTKMGKRVVGALRHCKVPGAKHTQAVRVSVQSLAIGELAISSTSASLSTAPSRMSTTTSEVVHVQVHQRFPLRRKLSRTKR